MDKRAPTDRTPGTVQPVVVISMQGEITYASSTFCEIIGLHRAEGRRYRDLLAPDMRRNWAQLHKELLASREKVDDHRFFNGCNALIRFTLAEQPDKSTAISGLVLGFAQTARGPKPGSKARDIDPAAAGPGPAFEHLCERIDQLEAQLAAARREMLCDPLTGLLNLAGIARLASRAILELTAEDSRLYMVALDIEDFETLNDLHGRKVGDRVLKLLGRRLGRPAQVVGAARIGAATFAVLVKAGPGTLEAFADSLAALLPRLFRPVVTRGLRIRVSGRAGVSVYGADAYDGDDLINNAQAALVEARRKGNICVQLFDTALAGQTRRRKALLRDLRLAIAEGLLHPVYQPIVSTREPGFVGVEVLCRWVHHEFGNIPPDEFIAIAAECGLMRELDLGVVAAACAELRPLIVTDAVKFVAFNFSPTELSQEDYAESFLSCLQAAGIPPAKVYVEVTEHEMIRDFDKAKHAIQCFKAAGITIVLDDYGTGYSNLRTLLDLPIDVIKIDKSLIADVAVEERAMQVVLSVVHLARVLGAELIAEGIETAAQSAVTRALGCQYVQGFLLSKPMRLGPLGEWLRQGAKGGPSEPRLARAEPVRAIKLVS